MTRFAILAPFLLVASCGVTIADDNDGGADASPDVSPDAKCDTGADCPSGYECAYPMSAGCGAERQCFPPAPECKKLVTACSCDLVESIIGDCNAAFPEPVTGSPCAGDCSNALACEICDATGFSPTQQRPPYAATQACASYDIATFVSACLASWTTPATCDTWQQSADVKCAACIFSQVGNVTWGPLLCDTHGCVLNGGGCVDVFTQQIVLEKSNGGKGSCGDLVSARDECVAYACAACTSTDVATCRANALAAECKSFEDAVVASSSCANMATSDGACEPQLVSEYNEFVKVFCGTGP